MTAAPGFRHELRGHFREGGEHLFDERAVNPHFSQGSIFACEAGLSEPGEYVRGKKPPWKRCSGYAEGLFQRRSWIWGKAPLDSLRGRSEKVCLGDARSRIGKACQELVAFSFPNLRILRGTYDETGLTKAFLEQDDLLTSGTMPLSETEQEVLTYVTCNQNNGERTSVEEIIRNFGIWILMPNRLPLCALWLRRTKKCSSNG